MATAVTTPHGHSEITNPRSTTPLKIQSAKQSETAAFVHDLIEDVSQKPLQAAAFAKHDMFREHINAMAISYFALIVLLILASLPLIAYLVNY